MALFIWAFGVLGAQAAPPELAPMLPQARMAGQGSMRFWGLHIYDAQLWVAPEFSLEQWSRQPLALELRYARSLRGADIAERSMVEMRRQPDFRAAREADWLKQMKALFPDVVAGDRVLGLLEPGRGIRFFYNGRALGEVQDAEFATLFLGIWLALQTSEPQLRQALLGSP